MEKVKAAVIGPGNIGTDLMYKIRKSEHLEMSAMIGVVESPGIERARALGIPVSTEGVAYLERNPDLAEIVFDATTARVHAELNAPVLKKLNKYAIDLTPAAVGPMVAPLINMETALRVRNVNVITCAGQAGTPVIRAVTSLVPIRYAELVTCSASKGVGPGSRINIDEFVSTTAKAYCELGGAKSAKVVQVIQPAIPEVNMRNTLYLVPDGPFQIQEIDRAVRTAVAQVQTYVPGYELTLAPIDHNGVITLTVSVVGAGDFLPTYAGNLDIMTASAVKIAEEYAARFLRGEITV